VEVKTLESLNPILRRGEGMAPQKRKDKPLVLLKSLVLVITCLSFLGILSCNWGSGTGSTSSSGSGSGTGTGWTIDIQVGTNPIQVGGTTTVMAIIKDGKGAPAPKGTYVRMTSVLNSFLTTSTPVRSVFGPTDNDLGQFILTYYAQNTGDDTVEVSSQGVIQRKTITVY